MKQKILQIFLIAFIVFMIGGILSSVSSKPSEDVSVITSDFDNISEYDTQGYASTDPFEEDDVNEVAKINGKVGNIVSEGINKVLNSFFELIKNFVS